MCSVRDLIFIRPNELLYFLAVDFRGVNVSVGIHGYVFRADGAFFRILNGIGNERRDGTVFGAADPNAFASSLY